MNKTTTILIFAVIIAFAIFAKVRDSLPVIEAEGEKLSWDSYSTHRMGLMRFRDLNKEKIDDKDIERAVLLSFAEDAVIRKELARRGKGDDAVKRIVDESIGVQELANIENATSQLYGWTTAELGQFVLYPQTRLSLLSTEFERDDIDLEAWLEKSLNEANISIYLWRWKWRDGNVAERF